MLAVLRDDALGPELTSMGEDGGAVALEDGLRLGLLAAYRKFKRVTLTALIVVHRFFRARDDKYESHFFAAGRARRANGRDVSVLV
jgi:hypothetical protein